MKTRKAVRTLFGANVAMLALAACVTINVYFPAARSQGRGQRNSSKVIDGRSRRRRSRSPTTAVAAWPCA